MKVQSELKAAKNQRNTFGKYNYRSCEDILEAVKPLLKENQLTLVITDSIKLIGERYYVEAKATVYGDVEPISSTGLAREAESKKGMDASQVTGSASSYARKYALNGLFAIDDAKDADTDEHARQSSPNSQPSKVAKKKATLSDSQVASICLALKGGNTKYTKEKILSSYELTGAQIGAIKAVEVKIGKTSNQ